jgi:Na+/melibiose symporter-like transporter
METEYLFVTGFQFPDEFLLLQLKCDILVGGQDRAYSFRNVRNREDAAQRLQSFRALESIVFHRRFVVLALNFHELPHRSKPYRFSFCEVKISAFQNHPVLKLYTFYYFHMCYYLIPATSLMFFVATVVTCFQRVNT